MQSSFQIPDYNHPIPRENRPHDEHGFSDSSSQASDAETIYYSQDESFSAANIVCRVSSSHTISSWQTLQIHSGHNDMNMNMMLPHQPHLDSMSIDDEAQAQAAAPRTHHLDHSYYPPHQRFAVAPNGTYHNENFPPSLNQIYGLQSGQHYVSDSSLSSMSSETNHLTTALHANMDQDPSRSGSAGWIDVTYGDEYGDAAFTALTPMPGQPLELQSTHRSTTSTMSTLPVTLSDWDQPERQIEKMDEDKVELSAPPVPICNKP